MKKRRKRRTSEQIIADLEARIEDIKGRSFSAKKIMAERERLELSAADYGELVGVTAPTIYNWEKGVTKPRRAQVEKLKAVLGMGKREAQRRLGYL